ncbi:MAG: hypothetical protein IPJ20_11900 [Flammeovirgaceae bacterium]|nr:hypothetical protein [Flammeovirgaceae bacterium]
MKADFDSALWIPVSEIAAQPTESFQHLVEQEGRPDLLEDIPNKKYSTGKYSQLAHAINPYGWGAYFTSSLTEVNIGITSRDVLSTTAINAGYLFDLNERTGSWNVGLSYQGLYPIFDVNFSSGNRSVNEGDLKYDKVVGTDTTSTTENLTFDWHENTVEGGIRIPLITTHSRFLSSVSFGNYVGLSHITDFVNSIDGGGRIVPTNYPQYIFRDYADDGNLFYNRLNISAYRLLKKSRRDINSKWGQALFVNLYNTPYGGDYSGNQFSFQGQLFFRASSNITRSGAIGPIKKQRLQI